LRRYGGGRHVQQQAQRAAVRHGMLDGKIRTTRRRTAAKARSP
jgi:hypothetical protein